MPSNKNWLVRKGSSVDAPKNCQGQNWGGAPPPAFHALVKDMSLNRGATHFEAMYYLILPIINIPAPPSQNYPVVPLKITLQTQQNSKKFKIYPFAIVRGFFHRRMCYKYKVKTMHIKKGIQTKGKQRTNNGPKSEAKE